MSPAHTVAVYLAFWVLVVLGVVGLALWLGVVAPRQEARRLAKFNEQAAQAVALANADAPPLTALETAESERLLTEALGEDSAGAR